MLTSIPSNDVEANLSYAYLHAIAARAGAVCKPGERDEDNKGIDATLRVFGPFPNALYRKSIPLDIQIKATVATPTDKETHWSYFIKGKERYEKLCEPCEAVPLLLVVLFLPSDAERWVEHTPESLILRRCAYWISLRDAPASTNDSGQTVYLPKNQMFTPQSLFKLPEYPAACGGDEWPSVEPARCRFRT